MSICPESDICSLYVDGELSEDERIKFEQHLRFCSKCEKDVNSYIKLKKYSSCSNIPEINLEQSFKKLTLKQSAYHYFLLYRFFYCCKKNKMFMKGSVITLLFSLVLVLVISIQNRISFVDSNSSFKPIIPIAYESHLPIHLQNIHLSSMNPSFNSRSNINVGTYKKMGNTFNSFVNLYSDLEHNEKCICRSNMPVINGARLTNYYADIPFCRSLNKK